MSQYLFCKEAHCVLFLDSTPCCCKCHYFFPFNGWVLFQCVYVPLFLYPLLCLWTFRLFPCLGLFYIVLQWALQYIYPFKSQFSLDRCPKVELLDQMVILFLVFWGISILFSIMSTQVYIPTNILFSTSSPAFVICRLINDGHFDWCEVIPHCSFDLHFSNN